MKNEDIKRLYEILSAILLLGNVQIFSAGRSGSQINPTDEYLSKASELLGLDSHKLSYFLTRKNLFIGDEKIVVNFNKIQGLFCRDNVSKSLYSHIVNYIFNLINDAMNVESDKKLDYHRSVIILDNCGFTNDGPNGFDQFCINYINDKLEWYYSKMVIETTIPSTDMDLVYSKLPFNFPSDISDQYRLMEEYDRIFSVINEESNRKQHLSETGTRKFYAKLTGASNSQGSKKFSDTTLGSMKLGAFQDNINIKNNRRFEFKINHYFGEISYPIEEFLDQNKDVTKKG
ncbi:Myosin-2 [Smittium mucronatum]|uniref:Myosin-2 n=1 Tax=Smittium mucronatum TaxID=133383 RepID=A0A1R0GLH8_9FUNG|nr:Myosin-2 [Smittium mucronatum]